MSDHPRGAGGFDRGNWALIAAKPVIGLAGGIGAGKSTVAQMLGDRGARVIDSDRIAREELDHPDVRVVLRHWWGDSVCGPQGRVDRGRVADIVFPDAAERKRLEGLIHPRVAARRREQIAAARSDPAVRMIVLDLSLIHI